MIQRPRNRQNRQHNAGSSGNSRGRGSHGRPSTASARNPHHTGQSGVPTTAHVVAGAHVSIVLKVDQPTGREVQGTVSEVLTSGNHSRGIKVRLADGRVGRVQRLVSEVDARAGSAGLSNLGRNGEPPHTRPTAPASRPLYRDYREEDDADRRPSGFTLADLIPDDDAAPHAAGVGRRDVLSPHAGTHLCPVCNEFEGDETAIAHHVSTHFD